MSAEGFCRVHSTDVEIGPDRRCLADGALAIPPSWARASCTWTGTGWTGDTGRPAGYVYELPAYARLAAPTPGAAPASAEPMRIKRAPLQHARPTSLGVDLAPAERACAHCGRPFVAAIRGASPSRHQAYCTPRCRERARRVRTRVVRSAERIACARCGADAPAYPVAGGPRRTYCGDACRTATGNAHERRRTLGERGQACVDCGATDRIHKAAGRCPACWAKGRRRRLREGQAA